MANAVAAAWVAAVRRLAVVWARRSSFDMLIGRPSKESGPCLDRRGVFRSLLSFRSWFSRAPLVRVVREGHWRERHDRSKYRRDQPSHPRFDPSHCAQTNPYGTFSTSAIALRLMMHSSGAATRMRRMESLAAAIRRRVDPDQGHRRPRSAVFPGHSAEWGVSNAKGTNAIAERQRRPGRPLG